MSEVCFNFPLTNRPYRDGTLVQIPCKRPERGIDLEALGLVAQPVILHFTDTHKMRCITHKTGLMYPGGWNSQDFRSLSFHAVQLESAFYANRCIMVRVAQSVGHPTRKSGVLGSIPGLATYFRFSFRFFKKGSCQLLAKVCARSTG